MRKFSPVKKLITIRRLKKDSSIYSPNRLDLFTMLNTRSREFIESEVEVISEYCERVFGVAIDLISFKNLVDDVVNDKVEDYIFHRIKDWPVKDLLILEKALAGLLAKGLILKENEPSEELEPRQVVKKKREPKTKAH